MAGSPKKRERLARWRAFTAQADAIDQLIESMIDARCGLSTWCRANDFAYSTTMDWIEADVERSVKYARARESLADAMADDIVSIADEAPPTDGETGRIDSAWVQWQRARVDARKWTASKLKPRAYGDNAHVEHTGAGGGPIVGRIELVPMTNDNGTD